MLDAMETIGAAFAALIVFVGFSSPIIVVGLVYYLKKRLDHKQIMAAIEKGTPLSELRPPKTKGPLWIRSLTAGIALLVISLPFLYMFLRPLVRGDHTHEGRLLPFGIFFAIGIAFFIRGLLQRKAEMQSQLADKNNTAGNKKPA
ncbi:MAG: hypothetical protein ACYS0I_18365 [Planctomycetota bacterium]|jgi:hypothetical protein